MLASTSRLASTLSLVLAAVGCGGSHDPPVKLGAERLGAPAWEAVDYHQFTANVGEGFGAVLASLLPEPNHAEHPEIGVGPGAAHLGPYDRELADAVAALGLEEHTTFTVAEGSSPNAILSAWMMVPAAGAATGSSPDFESGPIIPNTLFPVHVQVDAYAGGTLLDGYSYEFDVPALDAKLNPPFAVDGHSHFPMFTASLLGGLPEVPATLETHVRMTDVAGDGWDFALQYQAVE